MANKLDPSGEDCSFEKNCRGELKCALSSNWNIKVHVCNCTL